MSIWPTIGGHPEAPAEMKRWIGKRVMLRPGARKEVVGSFGEVTALQWSPFGWRLAVVLEKNRVEVLVAESCVREELASPKKGASS